MRDPVRKSKRDKNIVEAFYTLYDVKRSRIDDVLQILADDLFFMHPDTVYAVIFYNKDNKDYYNRLVEGAIKVPKRKLLKAL